MAEQVIDTFTTQQLAAEGPQVHLTRLAQAYVAEGSYFIADLVAPPIQSAVNYSYLSYESKWHGKKADNRRASGTNSNELIWNASKQTGSTVPYYAHMKIDDRDAGIFGMAALENVNTRMLAVHMKIQREVRVATIIEATASYASSSHYTTLTGTDQWSDYTGSDPEGVIKTAKLQVLNACGVAANTMSMPANVAQKLSGHPAVRDVKKFNAKYDALQIDDLLEGLPPRLWGLRVVVSHATYNSANPGQTQANAAIWGKHCFIGYVNPNPSPLDQSWMYQFENLPLTIKKGRSEYLGHSTIIEAGEDVDEKVVASAAGYIAKSVIA